MSDSSNEWSLYSKEVPKKGRGVFAGAVVPPRAKVLKFEGPVHSKETCPSFAESIQVDTNAWIWSSGGLDDLVNHSCNPNTGLWQEGRALWLLSLREIGADEEITFDYSTSMVGEPWFMDCECHEPGCRGRIGNFVEAPLPVQLHYLRLGVLPKHVMAAMIEEQVRCNAESAPKSAPASAPALRSSFNYGHLHQTGDQVPHEVVSNQLSTYPQSVPDFGEPDSLTVSGGNSAARSLAVRSF